MSRCVECGRPKEAHIDGVTCPDGRKTKYSSMALPEGATCSDCIHIRFCLGFLGDVAKNTSCDWFPIRFVPRFCR